MFEKAHDKITPYFKLVQKVEDKNENRFCS